MEENLVFTPSDFVGLLNQTLEFAYPIVVIEGELTNFKVSKNRWVYFDLVDENASVRFFGNVYQLPGPLEDGLTVRVVGNPKMHPRFGFSINLQSIVPVGQGALKKAADLLFKKLEAEGLFKPERKRLLPDIPQKVGLITAADSAAAADFAKILNERWGGVVVDLVDVYVQGQQAPVAIINALEYFNQASDPAEVLVITRGGGSVEDLAAFSDERVVRAVAASRIPTLVAIGHEVDISLSELAADQRASTPSNAVQMLVPDKKHELAVTQNIRGGLLTKLQNIHESSQIQLKNQQTWLHERMANLIKDQLKYVAASHQVVKLYNPKLALQRGYSLARKDGKYLKSIKGVDVGDKIELLLSDGTIKSKVEAVHGNN